MQLLILSIVLSVVTIGVLLFLGYKRSLRKGGNKISMLTSLLGICWFLILLFGVFTKVDANEVGIVYHDHHGVMDQTKSEGFQTKSIFEHITKISYSKQNR